MQIDETWLDDDIAAMELSYSEKSGLQIYRNYTNSFEAHAINRFRESLSGEDFPLEDFIRLTSILTFEDIRFIPVIVCGYADSVLKSAFTMTLPPNTPGGIKDILSGYGPLSDLSKRIRMAFAFDVMSRDLMLEVDRIRKVRNRLSHDWDIKAAEELMMNPSLSDMYPIELDLSDRSSIIAGLPADTILRIRSIWLAGRLTYEGATYHRAKATRLSPYKALYENGGTTWLKSVAKVCMDATLKLSG